jgi:aspartate carbamoyltransferase catalytic subunit
MARNILSINDFSKNELETLSNPQLVGLDDLSVGRGSLAFLFMQPSLRTMSSFANAGAQLGLAPVAIRTTGDSFRDQVDLEDEIRQLALNSRCVVARTTSPLNSECFANMKAPLVNAGDGSNEHPTQTLIDLTTLRQLGLEGRHVVLAGNLRDHRVHHSLVQGLVQLDMCSVELICPQGMAMTPPYLPNGLTCTEVHTQEEADEVLCRADFVYLTPAEYYDLPHVSGGNPLALNFERAQRVLKPSSRILHPFPRLTELNFDVDHTSYDGYHLETSLATPVRQRLLAWLLGD